MQDSQMPSVVEVKTDVRRFIIDNFLFGSDDPLLTDEASFLQTGIIDSTGILELISYVEDSYNIEIADDDVTPENLDSLDRIAKFVVRKLESGAR